MHTRLVPESLQGLEQRLFNKLWGALVIFLTKAWFPLNVSVVATNLSCSPLLRFAGFHRRPLFGLMRAPLYLEA